MPLRKYLAGLNARLFVGQFTKFIGPVQIESLNIEIDLRFYVTGQRLWEKHAQLSQTIAKIHVVLLYFIA
jgi:hypothetical protein